MKFKKDLESFSLSYTTKELLDSIDDNIAKEPTSSVFSKNKRAWFKDIKPDVINNIDRQLRKQFKIEDKYRLNVCIYYPPENYSGDLIIKDRNQNVVSRVLISTIQEYPTLSFGKMGGENLNLKPWTAYQSPPMIGGLLSYSFNNSRTYVTPPKKGFRSIRKTKNVSQRYLLLFDYLISEDELLKLTQDFSKLLTDNKESSVKEDPMVEEALKQLQN